MSDRLLFRSHKSNIKKKGKTFEFRLRWFTISPYFSFCFHIPTFWNRAALKLKLMTIFSSDYASGGRDNLYQTTFVKYSAINLNHLDYYFASRKSLICSRFFHWESNLLPLPFKCVLRDVKLNGRLHKLMPIHFPFSRFIETTSAR